ncbi:alpha-ketoacid dehydrogenase subunit beta [Mesoplasma corruscae]|uniref:Pyruvate dehydrogenase E1 component subunit beta n=1 Tax=Mesoplasma corruscae TaxID=216874 RepID=A0A2S5RH53_9MOLU|nr:alpha-ketoacid dehydrogenase subunit beta [Mesoplasma corruscae]PPE06633.1 pyruvate dehydrogenase E1 component subunit beta [Mesoplasma corruscae]
MAIINSIKAVTEALDVAMDRDPNVIVFGEDVGLEGGVFRATQGLQQKYGIERSFNAPISEAMFAGVGLGMAMNGMKPVIELQFQGLGLPSLQNIITNISRMRNRSRGKWTAPLVIRMPMGGGIRALEHHSEALEVIYAHIPGIKTVLPSTPYDTKGLILAAIESPDPVIVLEPTKLYRAFKQEVPEGYFTVPIGEGFKIFEGNDLTVVTYGSQTVDCMKAVELLKVSHPNATIELIDLRSIQPWDKKMVIESVKKTGRLLVVHEAVRSFSVSTEIITTVNEKCFEYLKAPLSRCTGYDVIIPYDRGEGFHQVNPQKILVAMQNVLDYKF